MPLASLQYWLQYLLPSSARQLQAGWAHFFLSVITARRAIDVPRCEAARVEQCLVW